MINTVSCQWFSQKCAPKCINRLSLAISLKFSQCAILATTLAAKAWAHRNVAVGTSLKISPHKVPPPPPLLPPTHTHGENGFQNEKQGEKRYFTWRKKPT